MNQLPPALMFAFFSFVMGYVFRMQQTRNRPYFKTPETAEEWRRLADATANREDKNQ